MTDTYSLRTLNDALRGTPFAGKLHHFATIHSTNACALEQAQQDAPTGSVYFADEQTAGRGRGGHSWHSEPGAGLYVSILLRPRLSLTSALMLSLATGLAVRSAIAEVCGLVADIRWPNDVLLGNRKCCGILIETAAGSGLPAGQSQPSQSEHDQSQPGQDQLRHIVIGVGLNVNHTAFPAELAALATSLRIETGYHWPRHAVLLALLQSIHTEVQRLESEAEAATDGGNLADRFAAASTWVRGKHVHVDEADGYTGVTEGLDERGFLLVRTANGLRTVLSGGVREPK